MGFTQIDKFGFNAVSSRVYIIIDNEYHSLHLVSFMKKQLTREWNAEPLGPEPLGRLPLSLNKLYNELVFYC